MKNVLAQIENVCVLQSCQKTFSNHWARHRRMYKYVCSASRRVLIPVFCFYQVCLGQCWELAVSVNWASYYVSSAVITLPRAWSFFPLRYMWVLISHQPDILRSGQVLHNAIILQWQTTGMGCVGHAQLPIKSRQFSGILQDSRCIRNLLVYAEASLSM